MTVTKSSEKTMKWIYDHSMVQIHGETISNREKQRKCNRRRMLYQRALMGNWIPLCNRLQKSHHRKGKRLREVKECCRSMEWEGESTQVTFFRVYFLFSLDWKESEDDKWSRHESNTHTDSQSKGKTGILQQLTQEMLVSWLFVKYKTRKIYGDTKQAVVFTLSSEVKRKIFFFLASDIPFLVSHSYCHVVSVKTFEYTL
jgi:hypothetical protein